MQALPDRLYGQSNAAQQKLREGESEYLQKNHIGLNRIKRVKNDHPTVKSLELIRYLVNLIKPPKDAIILDPFCGSGSTAMVCEEMGIHWIAIDNDPHSIEIAAKRIEFISKLPKQQELF